MINVYDDKDDSFKDEYKKFEKELYKDIRKDKKFYLYTNGFGRYFVFKDMILNYNLDRDIEATTIGVLYQHDKYVPPGLWYEIPYTGDIRNDVLTLMNLELFGLFYFKTKSGSYEFFSVGYQIPGYYALAPGSVIMKHPDIELDYSISVCTTPMALVEYKDRAMIISGVNVEDIEEKTNETTNPI